MSIELSRSWYRQLLNKSGLIILAGLVSACGVTGSKKLDQALAPATVAQPANPQARIGADENPKIVAANGGAYSRAGLGKFLDETVKTLIAYSGNPQNRFSITVLNTPSVNAFALPGGYLYVTRGLLALADNSAEVAAVLAHEMAHVSANHGIERSKKLSAAKLADRVVLDVLTNDRAGKIALAANKISFSKFSQNQELQADSLGIRMIGKAGYDPFAAARFLTAMSDYARYQKTLSDGAADEDFLATHPSTPRRIELARRHARFFGPPGSGIINRENYLAAIDGILYGDSTKEGYVRGNRFSHIGLGITFKVPDRFEITNKADAVVASGPDQIAVRFDGVSQPLGTTLTEYMQSGWVNGLDKESIRQTKINGLEAAYGKSAADDWVFEITLIRTGNQIYRFILAAPKSTKNAAAIAQQISGTFRKLTRTEKLNLKPLKLKIVRVDAGDTIAVLAGRMQGVRRRLDLFRLLNGLKLGDRLKQGQRVKIVVNG